jgi:hypothetical protein
MKYLKLFEDHNEYYQEINYDRYIDYYTSHTPDHSYRSIIKQITARYLDECIKKEVSDIPYEIRVKNINFNNDHLINKISVLFFTDEYMIVTLSFFNISDRYFFCDGRDGFIQFLKMKIKYTK